LRFAAAAYPPFPHYLQCDPQWGQLQMGVPGMDKEDDTICDQGCAMTSLSMALAGFKFTINGSLINPLLLNQWLRLTSGYHCDAGDCCNLVLNAPNQLNQARIRSLGEPQTPFLSTLTKMVSNGLIVLAHVPFDHPHHFVLLTGFKAPSTFSVNDPFYPRTTYDYNEIHDVLLYDILSK